MLLLRKMWSKFCDDTVFFLLKARDTACICFQLQIHYLTFSQCFLFILVLLKRLTNTDFYSVVYAFFSHSFEPHVFPFKYVSLAIWYACVFSCILFLFSGYLTLVGFPTERRNKKYDSLWIHKKYTCWAYSSFRIHMCYPLYIWHRFV